jgi:hypothetical protein
VSDNQLPAAQRDLLSTDDPMVWAEEFVRIFRGAVVGSPEGNVASSRVYIDAGAMVVWFANAMQVALDIKAQQDEIDSNVAPIGQVPEAHREAFIEGFEDGRQPSDLDDPTKP